MLVRSVREANQNFSKLISEVEDGETVLITKNGRTVAESRSPRIEWPIRLGEPPMSA